MPIRVIINIDWNKLGDDVKKQIDSKVEDAFKRASMDAVTWSKLNHGYTQQTGALNSSTGFQLYKDGTLLCNYFEQAQGGSDKDGAKAKGIAAGQNAAEKRASQLNAHICSVIVAGMPYAIYVESGHTVKKKDGTKVWVTGRDVLAGAYHEFLKFLETRMQEAFKNQNVPYQITVDE